MADYIYGLVCPVAGVIRYIGKSDDPDRRFKFHLSYAPKGTSHKDRWIAKLGRQGLVLSMVVIREVAEGEDWAEVEREEIAKGWAAGLPLTNMTLGGDGAFLNKAGREAKLAAMGKPETRTRMSVSARARWSDPEKGAKGRAENGSPERCRKVSEGARRRATPEYRAMMAERSRAAWADPDKRAKIVAGMTPEVRAKVSAASKEAWASSPNMARSRMNISSPETRRKIDERRPQAAAKMVKLHADAAYKARMRETWDNPDYRERLSQALKQSWERRRKG
jgi:hypothetical protein